MMRDLSGIEIEGGCFRTYLPEYPVQSLAQCLDITNTQETC